MLAGFGNLHQSEVTKGLLPDEQNSPQTLPHKLYAEQLNGSAFTRERRDTLFTWAYRRLPSVVRPQFEAKTFDGQPQLIEQHPPHPMRWDAINYQTTSFTFVEGLRSISGNAACQIYLYQCNQSMTDTYFANLDGDLLFIPWQGKVCLKTELGELELAPGQIVVIPRGFYWKMAVLSETTCGYLCENLGHPFQLPELGVIGVHGLAHPNHFEYPEASIENEPDKPITLINKYQHKLWAGNHSHTPLNVAAWRGNFAPYRYDLKRFNTINTVSYDHLDPSIFTVLTSPSSTPGVAAIDFVIFPPRWMVADHSFRPPYFHRNVMSEFMGLIHGKYDAKQSGFVPGGFSIHNAMIPHGPDSQTTKNAQAETLNPQFFEGGLAFMLESNQTWSPSEWAFSLPQYQKEYQQCWENFAPGEI